MRMGLTATHYNLAFAKGDYHLIWREKLYHVKLHLHRLTLLMQTLGSRLGN